MPATLTGIEALHAGAVGVSAHRSRPPLLAGSHDPRPRPRPPRPPSTPCSRPSSTTPTSWPTSLVRRSPPAGRDDDQLVSLPTTRDDEAEEGGGLPWATLPAAMDAAASDDAADDRLVPDRLPSDLVAIADTPFEQLDPAALARLGRLAGDGVPRVAPPSHASRRAPPVGTADRSAADDRPLPPHRLGADRAGPPPAGRAPAPPARAVRREPVDAGARHRLPPPHAGGGAGHRRRGVRLRHLADAAHADPRPPRGGRGDRRWPAPRWTTASAAPASPPTCAPCSPPATATTPAAPSS